MCSIGLAALLVAGCASSTTAPNGSADPRTPAAKIPAAGLNKDMTPEQVRSLLGNPDSTKPMKAPEGHSEVWTYQLHRSTNVRMVPVGSHDVPYVDPMTGEQRMISEPAYERESVDVVEELRLLWYNDRLVSWKKVTRQGNRDYD